MPGGVKGTAVASVVEDLKRLIEAGALAKGGEIFVLDMGQPVKILDLAEDLIKLSGLEPGVDINIVYTGLRPGEKLYEELLLKEEGLQKTENKKIFVGKPGDLSFNEIMMRVNALKNCLNDPDSLRECMTKVVPTYQYVREQPKADAQPKAVAKARALAKPRAAAKFKAAASQSEAVGRLEAANQPVPASEFKAAIRSEIISRIEAAGENKAAIRGQSEVAGHPKAAGVKHEIPALLRPANR